MKRHEAIEGLVRHVAADDLILSTTGMISRELFATCDRPENFYMIGSMGLLAAFGLGIALQHPDRRVIVIEGDGSFLMSMGSVPLIANETPVNYHHVVLDNAVYQSTGGQPTISAAIDLSSIMQSVGYRRVAQAVNVAELDAELGENFASPGPTGLHVRVEVSEVEGISRVSHAPESIRDRFRGAVGAA